MYSLKFEIYSVDFTFLAAFFFEQNVTVWLTIDYGQSILAGPFCSQGYENDWW